MSHWRLRSHPAAGTPHSQPSPTKLRELHSVRSPTPSARGSVTPRPFDLHLRLAPPLTGPQVPSLRPSPPPDSIGFVPTVPRLPFVRPPGLASGRPPHAWPCPSLRLGNDWLPRLPISTRSLRLPHLWSGPHGFSAARPHLLVLEPQGKDCRGIEAAHRQHGQRGPGLAALPASLAPLPRRVEHRAGRSLYNSLWSWRTAEVVGGERCGLRIWLPNC